MGKTRKGRHRRQIAGGIGGKKLLSHCIRLSLAVSELII